MPDELTRRVRSLEAERLRPVPPAPPTPHRDLARELLDHLHTTAPAPPRRRTRPAPPGDPALRALRRAGDRYRATNPAPPTGDDQP